MKQPSFVFSIDAKAIFEILQPATVGQIVPYEEMTKAIGRNVQNGARGVMETARKRAQRELGLVFAVIPNIGLKRMSDVEIVKSGSRVVDVIRRASRRGQSRLAAIRDVAALPSAERTQMFAYESFYGAITMVSSQSSVKRLEAKVAKEQASLPLAKTLEAFKG